MPTWMTQGNPEECISHLYQIQGTDRESSTHTFLWGWGGLLTATSALPALEVDSWELNWLQGKLDAQRQLWNPPVSFPQFPILTLVTWRQDKNKLWVPEREGNSREWAVVQAGRVILRHLARGGRGHPSVVPKLWPLNEQQSSPENVEPQKFRVSKERPGPGELTF